MLPQTSMNGFELGCLLLALGGIFGYAWRSLGSARAALLVALLAALPLYASVERATQFLTIDEIYIIEEPLDLAHSTMSQWRQGALRTTDVVVGAFSALLAVLPHL